MAKAKATEIPIEELRRNLSELVRRASFGGERFLVTFHGKPTCALVPVEDLQAAPRERARKPKPRK